MKNSYKNVLSAILCSAMLLTVTACGGNSAQTSSGASETASGSTGENGGGSETYTTITAFCANTASMPMTNDITVVKALSEKTKTNFDFTVSPTTGTEEKFNLMMASGDIPDMVIYVQDPILKYTKAFAPLNDLIQENCPNYAALMEEHPFLKKDITAVDGNIYTIQSLASLKFANCVIVRKDWLDKLNLEVPKTLEDYYNVLKAFKTGDPNGNGEQDEIPLITSVARRADAESPGLSMFDACWGIDEDFYLSDDGSQILFGATDPRMKEALTYLNRLYSEGLIDPEYLTRDWASYEGLQADEKAGMWLDWGVGVDSTLIQNPDCDLEIILPPEGTDGKVKVYSQMPQVRTNAMAISKDSKNKEHIMSIFNYIFSDEGYMLTNYGVEGETYNMVNGEPQYVESILNDGNGPLSALRKQGINSWIPLKQSKGFEYTSDKFESAVSMYEKDITAPVPPLKFTDEEKSTLTSVYTGEIKTYLDESLDSFITGKTPLSGFDAFVENLNKMGLNDILKIYNDAYARYNAN